MTGSSRQEERNLDSVLWHRLGRGPSRRRLGQRRGKLVTKRRISDNAAGFAALLQVLADAGDSAEEPIPVAIETGRGLLVACLRATGRKVFAINPMAVSRYRDRHSVARKKSDAGDALVLANILRTDLPSHRPLPADSKTRPGHRRARPRAARRRLGPHLRTPQAALATARVLPGDHRPPLPTNATGCCAPTP